MNNRVKVHFKKHHVYYITLLLVQLLGLYLTYLTSSFDYRLQMLVVIMTTAIYIVWALLHHYVEHDISSKIVIEYLLMGSLGISIIFFLLK